MEVISNGITPETWRYHGKCPHCQTTLAVQYRDINMYPEQGFFKSRLRFKVKCCVCHNPLFLKESEVPSIIRRAILDDMPLAEKLLKFF